MADDSRKLELIADLARARGELTAHTRAVRRELDVPARLKSSFRRHGLVWLAGAGLLGLLLTRLPRRKKPVPHAWRKPPPEVKAAKAGLLITALKFAFDIVRPALAKWIAHQVTAYTEGRSHTRSRR
jgi:hypothetical protein